MLIDPDYGSRLGFLQTARKDMAGVLDLFATPERPVVVFVDDLDRCSPGAVKEVVEALNDFVTGTASSCSGSLLGEAGGNRLLGAATGADTAIVPNEGKVLARFVQRIEEQEPTKDALRETMPTTQEGGIPQASVHQAPGAGLSSAFAPAGIRCPVPV